MSAAWARVDPIQTGANRRAVLVDQLGEALVAACELYAGMARRIEEQQDEDKTPGQVRSDLNRLRNALREVDSIIRRDLDDGARAAIGGALRKLDPGAELDSLARSASLFARACEAGGR